MISLENRNESYFKIKDELGGRQLEVLNVIESHPEGLAGFEVAKILHTQTYMVLPRIKELRDKGFLTECGTKFNEQTERNVTVYKISEASIFGITTKRERILKTVVGNGGLEAAIPLKFDEVGQGVFLT